MSEDAGLPYLPPPADPGHPAPSASSEPVRSGVRTGVKVALVAAGIAAGAIGATALGANAASNGDAATPAYYSGSGVPSAEAPDGHGDQDGDGRLGGPRGPGGPGGTNPNEKAVSATIAAKLKAAALAKVPGATVDRVETDSGDATYEAHMTKSDGTHVTVKFDKNLAVTAVEDGRGK